MHDKETTTPTNEDGDPCCEHGVALHQDCFACSEGAPTIEKTPLYGDMEQRKREIIDTMQKIVNRLSPRLGCPILFGQSVEAMKDDLFFVEVLAKQCREGTSNTKANKNDLKAF